MKVKENRTQLENRTLIFIMPMMDRIKFDADAQSIVEKKWPQMRRFLSTKMNADFYESLIDYDSLYHKKSYQS